MSTDEKIDSPCPFCGKHDLYPDTVELMDSNSTVSAFRASVQCMDCNAIGPSALHEDGDVAVAAAIEKWDARVNA